MCGEFIGATVGVQCVALCDRCQIVSCRTCLALCDQCHSRAVYCSMARGCFRNTFLEHLPISILDASAPLDWFCAPFRHPLHFEGVPKTYFSAQEQHKMRKSEVSEGVSKHHETLIRNQSEKVMFREVKMRLKYYSVVTKQGFRALIINYWKNECKKDATRHLKSCKMLLDVKQFRPRIVRRISPFVLCHVTSDKLAPKHLNNHSVASHAKPTNAPPKRLSNYTRTRTTPQNAP